MYFIIETSDQLSKLSPSDSCFIQVIPSSDRYHPELSRCSLVYYNDGAKGFIFPVNHSEGFSLEVAQIQSFINQHKTVYLLDRKFHSYFLQLDNSIDLNFIRLDQGVEGSKLECDTLLHRDFGIRLETLSVVNEIIPITKHYERCQCLYNKVQSLFDLQGDYSILNRASDAYNWVEKQGIAVDQTKFTEVYGIENSKNFIKSGLVYSYYNMYNTTGRPTNSYSGVNFVAVPKTKEFRECFIPRHDYLVEFDFDAYHLRLIAQQIKYEFPDKEESIHKQLGRVYFLKQELSEEEYTKSKEITFKQLYGGIDQKYADHPFFSKLGDFIDDIWRRYKKDGSLILPTGTLLRRNSEMNKLKLFNYWVQNLETKNNTNKIERLREVIGEAHSKLILITYDAFLFDYSIQDGKEFLIKVKDILQEGGFKVKHKHAKDYFFN
jgi:hypothetical protein